MKRLICLAVLPMLFTGCARVMHELQPHRLWRMNYTDAPGRTEGAFFSVDDQLPSSAVNDPDEKVAEDASCHSGR